MIAVVVVMYHFIIFIVTAIHCHTYWYNKYDARTHTIHLLLSFTLYYVGTSSCYGYAVFCHDT